MVRRFEHGDLPGFEKLLARLFDIAGQKEGDLPVSDAKHDASIVEVLQQNAIRRRREHLDSGFPQFERRAIHLHLFHGCARRCGDDLRDQSSALFAGGNPQQARWQKRQR